MSVRQLRARRGRKAARLATVESKSATSLATVRPAAGGARWTIKAALLASAAGVILAPGTSYALDASALPTGGQVTNGSAGISSSGATMNVNQSSQKAIINWQTFNIGSQATVNFQQPNASSIALNKVLGGGASEIDGHMNANGQVFLVNPSGITFGTGAQVNVGGLVASTLGIADDDFLNGNYKFTSGHSGGAIRNQGTITAADHGYIGFLAPNVVNDGKLVTGRFGTVALAAGDAATLSFDSTGTSLVSVQVDPASVQTLIENHNLISAPDGRVIMSAHAATTLLGAAINNSGIIEADSLTSDGGVVSLDATGAVTNTGTISASGATGGGTGNGGNIKLVSQGTTTVAGSLIARGGPAGGNGGTIETSGHNVIFGGAAIDTRAPNGKTGTWLLDPYDLTITDGGTSGANTISNTDVDNELATTNVVLQTTGSAGDGNGNGDINVNGALWWYSPYGLTLSAFRNINVNANITHVNSGGALALNPNTGGGGGMLNVADGSSITLNPDLTLTIGGTQYTLISTAAQLQAIGSNLAGDYAVANDLDMTGISFAPIGGLSSPFTGAFEGLGHGIGNLTINAPSSSYVGLFGANAGTVNDIHLSNESVTGLSYVGGLAGFNYGLIANSSVQGSIAGGSGSNAFIIGGLVGCNCVAPGATPFPIGTIVDSFALTSVTAGTGVSTVGGFVGSNEGTISGSFTIGAVTAGDRAANVGGFAGTNGAAPAAGQPSTISGSFAQDTVTVGSAAVIAGGFVGNNVGVINGGSYARGTVAAGDGSSGVGGFAGSNSTSAQGIGGLIDGASAVGPVMAGSGAQQVGGLVGYNAGTISNSFSAGTVTAGDGGTMIGGLVGRNDGRGGPGTVSNSYTLVGVHAGNGSTDVGGLLGYNSGFVTGGYTSGMTVISGDGSTNVGGMFGLNDIGGVIEHTDDYGYNNLVSVGSASTNVGGLVGTNSGILRNGDYSTGTVSAGSGSSNIGGLVGTNSASGSIDDSWGVGTVTGSASTAMGGLAGSNSGTISNSYGAGTFGAGDATLVGGLVGDNRGLVSADYALGTVMGNSQVGGLVGRNGYFSGSATATVTNSYSNTNVSGASDVGGLVGANYASGVIDSSHTYGGQVAASGGNAADTGIGGLAGYDQGIITNSYNTTNVQAGDGAFNVGGLVGIIDSSAAGGVTAGYSTGSVVAGGGSNGVGGLVGFSSNVISDSYATGPVTSGPGSSNIGGLVGLLNASATHGTLGTVDTSYATGAVSAGSGSTAVGGLVGLNSVGTVINSWASTTVTAGDNSQNIGGLVGTNANGTISGAGSFGQVNGGNGVQNVGGLVGLMQGSSSTVTNNSQSSANVTAGANSNAIGGYIGQLSGGGTVAGSGSGTVTAGPGSTNVGGQIGETTP